MSSKKKSTIILSHSGKTTIPESTNTKEQNNAKSNKYNPFNFFRMKGYGMPTTLEEQLTKKELRISSEQKTPYNINRNVILFVYFALIVLTNRLFFGWPNLSNLLFREDTYIWKCKKNADGTYDRLPDKRYVCDDQDKAVQTIFVFGSSAYFAFSFFNGLIVDYLGSRFSMLLGHILNLIGWILMLVSNENFDAYVIGGIFMSASIDLASFSTLNASGLYPGNENLIVNIISGAGSLSTGTMTILDLIISGLNLSFKAFMMWYICISVGFFFILTIFLFPRTRYFRQYEIDNYYKNKEISLTEKGEVNILKKGNEYDYALQKVDLHEDVEMESINQSKGDYNEVEAIGNKKLEDYASTNNSSITSKKNLKLFKYTTFRDLFNIFTCAHFLCLWIYGPLNAIYNTFYYSVVENILSKDKNDILGYILPFSFIPCVILGNITDKFGVMIMFAYELIFAFSMYAFSYSKSSLAQWISVISNTLYSACANGQLWTFISYTFSSKYHSTLIGFLNFVCGIMSFARLLLFEWAKYSNYDFTYINLLILCMIGVNIALAIVLVFIRKIKGEKVTYGDENISK
ncbi:transporter, putative [Plasmodium relictum]|uniref:Transporter, putative n=1 Tax=Plasmodium relictum TaxID=85471 RepID=A0A1J1H6J9_PLARL|nr:transporter, putative [Plasmodium relictum]CRH00171.1 transporter, putative [Plasmodium relictum]